MEKKKTVGDDIVKNALYQSVLGIISKFGGLIFTVIIARMLFPEAFGIYSLSLTIILTLVTLSDLGIGTAITRYVSDSLGKGNSASIKKEARSRFLFLIKFKIISSLILAILLFFLAGVIAIIFNKPELILPLRIGAIYLLVVSLYGIASPLFLALEKVKYSAIAEGIFELSRVALIFAFLYFYKNVTTVFIVLSVALLLAIIYSLYILCRKYKFLVSGKVKPVERKRLLLFSGFLALNSLNAVIFTNIDKLILGYFIDAKYIGFYTSMFTIISGAIGLLGVGGVLFPVFVHAHGEQLKRAFKKSFHYLFLFTFPFTVGLAFVFIFILKLLYGAAYVPVEYQTTIFITSIFLSSLILEGILTALYTTLFNAKEKPKWPALIMVFSAILNTFLVYLFVSNLIKIKPEYALIGAGVATFISRYFNLIVLSIFAKKKFKISPNKSSIIKSLIASAIMLLFMMGFSFVVKINTLTWIVMVLVSMVLYFVIMFLLKAINKEDFIIIKNNLFAKNKINK
jgi:stage V sporulation protein B